MLPSGGGWTLRVSNGGEPLRIQMVGTNKNSAILSSGCFKFFKIQLRDELHDKELTG